MKKKYDILKHALLVTIGSLLILVFAFILYYLVFMILETVANRDGSYNYVSTLRIGYGIVWIAAGIIIYRTKIYDWLKACILTGSLGAFMIGTGVVLFEKPILVGIIMFLVSSTSIFVLFKVKKKWYHYYAVALALCAALYYL